MKKGLDTTNRENNWRSRTFGKLPHDGNGPLFPKTGISRPSKTGWHAA